MCITDIVRVITRPLCILYDGKCLKNVTGKLFVNLLIYKKAERFLRLSASLLCVPPSGGGLCFVINDSIRLTVADNQIIKLSLFVE